MLINHPAIAWLLMAANTDPPYPYRDEFYQLKRQLLTAHGQVAGSHIQHILKPCWTCSGTGFYHTGAPCHHCWDGIYSEFWCKLEVREWHGYRFHLPGERQSDAFRDRQGDPVAIDIEGYVEHTTHPVAGEAAFWLFLVTDWSLFRHAMLNTCHRCRDRGPLLPLTFIHSLICRASTVEFQVEKLRGRVQRWLYPPPNIHFNDDDDIPF